MKKFITVSLLMLISPLVYAHPGHVEGGLYADVAHVLLGLVIALAVYGAGRLALRAFNSVRLIRQ